MGPLSSIVRRQIGKHATIDMVNYVGDDEERFAELVEYAKSEEYHFAMMATWGITHICEEKAFLMKDHHSDLIPLLHKPFATKGVRRNVCRTYQYVEIPEEYEGELYDTCLKFILDPKEAIAVRAFSIGVCERIAKKHTALKPELSLAIESILEHASAGLKNRGLKTVRRLRTE
jgi:hypothetical protein